ncbi:hypothetical protein [Aquimarina sp. I32.4]|uniref:hypothetical protein n=1 Tax=Aquimarina sp. I32.4 TaxID=2053903 RepID=UPI000CDE7CC8|nr:hypothetical protein [Aquimarina sp. I32.4]
MNKQGSVLTKEQYSGAPIERAHLHRGFSSKKTPLKWIRFFRACVLQRQHANDVKKKKINKIWIIIVSILVLMFIIKQYYYFPFTLVFIISILTGIIMTVRTKKRFKKNYTDGFDFFSDYFSAFFTLIEEDLLPQSRITLEANVKSTMLSENLKKKEKHEAKTSGFLSGTNYFYEKEISKGSCFFNDGSIVTFNFTERLRNRIVNKRSASGKRKTKQKYRSVYPFTLKMKIPKAKYIQKQGMDTSKVQMVEDENYYVVKTVRKFDIKNENPEEYNPYSSSSITMFSADYFSLELINLINASYSCVTPRV